MATNRGNVSNSTYNFCIARGFVKDFNTRLNRGLNVKVGLKCKCMTETLIKL